MAAARDSNFSLFSNLNGGLSTRPTPLVIEANSKSKLQSPALRNVDFFTTGSVTKRLGKTKQGGDIGSGAIFASQTTISAYGDTAWTTGSFQAIAQKIVAGSTANIIKVTFKTGVYNDTVSGYNVNLTAAIYTNSSGAPGTSLGESTAVPTVVTTSGGVTMPSIEFIFSVPIAVTSGTTYWFLIKAATSTTGQHLVARTNSSASANLSQSSNAGVTWSAAANADLYYIIYSSGAASIINGIYDYRYGATSTQKVLASAGGTLYWNDAGTWTSLVTGLGSGQDNLWAFATLKDYLFACDNGNNQSRIWNGTASYTPILGFRATFAAADNGSAGTVPDGVYKLLAVTTLTSGGYRASAEVSVTMAGGGTQQIAVSSIVMDGTSASNFGFDIGSTATKWFMTDAGGTVYYKIPAANMSVANPAPNSTTSFNITATTSLTAANTLLEEYGLEQPYFTTQISSPTGKYLAVFQNMLALAGDASYPSRVWFSGIADGTNLAGPQIWSTNGGLYGNYRDLDAQDGEVIVGIKEWNGNLYAFKRHSVFIISFTGVNGQPFEVRRLSGSLGALSHWSVKETQRGLVFVSERGPCICTGTTISLIPSAKNILDRFDLNNTSRYNLSAMAYTTAGNNSTKMQIHWGVSSTSATTRDITLVYDYENDCFWENDVSANYYTEVTDSNFFPSVWSGDYSAQVFRMDYGTNDNGSAIAWYFETPNLSLGKPFNVHVIDHLFISGAVQSSGTLTVDVYTDFSSTAAMTLSFDMSNANFKKGLNQPIGLTCSEIRFKLSNSTLDVPVQIDAIGIGWQDKGLRI